MASAGRPAIGRAAITGASAGIGAAYARALAARGYNLLLTARRADRLREVADALASEHGVDVIVHAADLADPNDLHHLEARLATLDDVTLLINNAGFGTRGHFAESDIDKEAAMVTVHDIAAMRLMRAVLPRMIQRGSGHIINVSSVAAFFTGTTYSASKAYLNVFSQGLQSELKGTGVRVQALCPGYTYSEFHDTEEYVDFSRAQIPASMWMTAEDVVAISLDALDQRRVILIPGWRNKLWVITYRVGLRGLARRVRDWLRG